MLVNPLNGNQLVCIKRQVLVVCWKMRRDLVFFKIIPEFLNVYNVFICSC